MSESNQIAIESTLHETRIFPPPPDFSANAHIEGGTTTLENFSVLEKLREDEE